MQTKDPKQKKKNTILGADLTHRIYGLDILRAYAIISIFINHTYEFFPEEYHHAMRYSTQQGVPIFFVLSGFLIGNILIKSFKEEALDRKLLLRFWTNRWMRTLPLYYIILALLFFCTYVLHLAPEPDPEKFGLLEKSSYLVFLYNFAWDKFPFFAEAWTLAVEEWFYFLTPLIIFFFRKCGFSLRQSVLTTIILVIFIGTNIRAYRIIHNISITHQVLPSLDCLMYGILGAYINTYHNKWWTNHQRIYFVPGLILFLLVGLQWVFEVNLVSVLFASTVLSIGILLMMPFFDSLKTGSGIIYKFLTYTSLISYSLYLLHFSFFKYSILPHLSAAFGLSNMMKVVLVFVVTYALATLSYKYIERPFMNMRRKIKFLK